MNYSTGQIDAFDVPFPAAAHRRVRHRKAKDCTEKADADTPKWSVLAYNHLCHFARARDGEFLGEEFIYTAIRNGLPAPADKRAFGSVFTKAAKAGVIKRVGWSTSTMNCSAKPVWRRV